METNCLESVKSGVMDPVTKCGIKSKDGAFSSECLKYDGVEWRTEISEQHYDICVFIMQEWEGHGWEKEKAFPHMKKEIIHIGVAPHRA